METDQEKIDAEKTSSYILGIDIGTGSLKALTTDLDGNFATVTRYSYPLVQPEKDFFEQDPETIWEAFKLAINDATNQKGFPPAAISLSSAMHSLILVNGEGKAIYPMLTWADLRSDAIAEHIRSSGQGEEIYRITGTPIHAMSPLCKLIWFKENRIELFKKAKRFISIKEFIWFKLFQKYEIDYSIASATGLFDIIELKWDETACELAGVTYEQLSKPVDTTHTETNILPEVARQLNLSKNTLFVIGASDGCCANLGSGAGRPGMGAVTIGTSGAVRVTNASPVYDYPGMTFNYLLHQGTFVSGGAINNGGIMIDWLLENFLNKTSDYQQLFNTISLVPAGSDNLICLPYLYGERAPIWDAKSSGSFLNVQPKHTQAHFLRAALEGVCYTLQDVLFSLEKATLTIDQITVSGGFTSSTAWVQLLADVTGKKLFLLKIEEASAMGAIYLAMQVLFPERDLPVSSTGTIFYPDKANHAVYKTMFPVFKKLYTDLKDTMHLLHQTNLPS